MFCRECDDLIRLRDQLRAERNRMREERDMLLSCLNSATDDRERLAKDCREWAKMDFAVPPLD